VSSDWQEQLDQLVGLAKILPSIRKSNFCKNNSQQPRSQQPMSRQRKVVLHFWERQEASGWIVLDQDDSSRLNHESVQIQKQIWWNSTFFRIQNWILFQLLELPSFFFSISNCFSKRTFSIMGFQMYTPETTDIRATINTGTEPILLRKIPNIFLFGFRIAKCQMVQD
jgi:hypothetical protein